MPRKLAAGVRPFSLTAIRPGEVKVSRSIDDHEGRTHSAYHAFEAETQNRPSSGDLLFRLFRVSNEPSADRKMCSNFCERTTAQHVPLSGPPEAIIQSTGL